MKSAHNPRKVRNRSRRKLRLFFLSVSAVIFLFSFVMVVVGILLNQAPDFISPLPLGKFITQRSNNTLSIEEGLRKAHIDYEGVYIAEDYSYLIKFKDGEYIYFSSKKPIAQQISSLQFVLSRLTIEGKRFSSLDFRFDNPVIVYRK